MRDRFPPLPRDTVAPAAPSQTARLQRPVGFPEPTIAAVKGSAEDGRWQEAAKKSGEDGKKLSQLLLRTMSAKVADQDGSGSTQASSVDGPEAAAA